MGKALAVLNMSINRFAASKVYIPQTTTKQQQQQQNQTNQKTIKHKKQTKQNKNMEICLRNINLIF